MNYIKAIQQALINDPEINAFIEGRIQFLYMDAETLKPYIVFEEGDRQNTNKTGSPYGLGGVDSFPVVFNIVTTFSQVVQGRELRNLLIAKLNGFRGVLRKENNEIIREGNIGWRRDFAPFYIEEKSWVVWGSEFLFRNHIR